LPIPTPLQMLSAQFQLNNMTTFETAYGKIEIAAIEGTAITKAKSDDIDDILAWEHATRNAGRDTETNYLGHVINKFHAHVIGRLIRKNGSTVARGVGYSAEDCVKAILVESANAEAERVVGCDAN
jgi:hypothetical protein